MAKKNSNTPVEKTQLCIDNRSEIPFDGMKIIGQDATTTVVVLPQCVSRVHLLKDGSLVWASSLPDGQTDKDCESLIGWIGNNNICCVSSINGKPVKPTFPMTLDTFEMAVNPTFIPGVMGPLNTITGEVPVGSLIAVSNHTRRSAWTSPSTKTPQQRNKELEDVREAAKTITPADVVVSALHHSAVMSLMQSIAKKRDEFLVLCNKIVELYYVLPAIIACDGKGGRIGCVCFVQYCIVGFGEKKKSTKKTH